VTRSARLATSFVALASVIFASTLSMRVARAQDTGIGGASPAGGGIGPASARPDVVNTPESSEHVPQGKNSIKLFDSRRSITSYQLDIGPLWSRKIQDETGEERVSNFRRCVDANGTPVATDCRDPGTAFAGEVAIGTTYTTPYKPFYLVGAIKTLFRIVDDKSFSWSLFNQDLGVGAMLGPIEPELRLGLSVLNLDIFHAEPSISLFSPRVTAGFGVHIGKIRVDIKAHSEYLWRWFGPDYLIRGVTIGLRLDLTRPKNPFPGATDSAK
jgi:hypothetical protein